MQTYKKIELHEIKDDTIEVFFDGQDISVNKSVFESWVDKRDKREWGNIQGDTGLTSWEDYYAGDYLMSDLSEFLTVRNFKTGKLKDMPDLYKAFKQLTSAIKKESA